MGTPARRDDLLEQIRALPIEDRDFIEAALMREAYDQGRRTESPDELEEVKQRAVDALSGDLRERRGIEPVFEKIQKS